MRPDQANASRRAHDDHVLRDGTTVHIRPVRTDDADRLLAMWDRTSSRSRRARFLDGFEVTADNIKRFTDFDPAREFALVATFGRGDDERIVGACRYVREADDPSTAEFGALVEDGHQGHGIGTALMREVFRAAHDHGIQHLVGDILAENQRMITSLREYGIDGRTTRDAEILSADFDVQLSESFLRVTDGAERDAARAALTRFFAPERVAVVGASRDPKAIGGLMLRNLLDGHFRGVIYPVNPNTPHVQGVAAYDSLADCPEVPDLVFVAVPAALVNGVVEQAGNLGIKAVCVISAGFGEAGTEGEARQEELEAIVRGHGLRLVGPNCMGLMNAAGHVRMNGTFSDTFPLPGRLAFSSQSGGLGMAVLDHAHALGLGISTFISVGNKADISGNDLLMYWEQDPDTDVILLYLESFGNPRKFSRIARRISRHKPIVAVKSGRTSAGVRAASSHTAAISAGDVAVSALFSQTGVIRTTTLEELFDVARLLSHQPLPGGINVAILTNAGGPGILAADACESSGLQVPSLSDDTRARLLEFLPPEAGISNPVDMIASANPANYRRAARVLGAAPEVDALFVVYVEAGVATNDDVGHAIVAAMHDLAEDETIAPVPIVTVLLGTREEVASLTDADIPTFAFPEDAARALGRVAEYAQWRRRPLGTVVIPDRMDPAAARRVVEAALATTTGTGERAIGTPHTRHATGTHAVEAARSVWLRSAEAEAVLRAYGVTLARSRVVRTPDEAAAAQAEFGGPVAVKLASPVHKTDVGGIRLDLRSPAGAAKAVEEMRASLIAADLQDLARSFMVQEMVNEGVEMVVGVTHDPSFGPLVMTGMGGTLVELLRDVSVRVTPLTDTDVDDMIDGLRMKPLLTGYRGGPAADVPALRDLLHRINAMVDDLPEILELDLNPVFVRPQGKGVVAVDVRMKVAEL